MRDKEAHAVSLGVCGLATLGGLAFGAFSLWCTFIAFRGGTLPLFGWRLEGGFLTGVLWLFVADPILSLIGCGVGALIAIFAAMVLRIIASRSDAKGQ